MRSKPGNGRQSRPAGRITRAAAAAAAAALAVQALAAGPASASPWPPGDARPGPGLVMPAPGSAAMAAWRRAHGLRMPPRPRSVPGHHAFPVAAPPPRPPRPVQAPPPAFPAPADVVVTVPAAARPPASAWARAAGTPVQVAPAPGPAPAVPAVRVTVASHARASAAGADGMLFTLARADAGTAPGRVRIKVSYASFASAYGASFGDRLVLFEMPPCALTAPGTRVCRALTPVAGAVNHWRAKTITATVSVPPAGTAVPALALAGTLSDGTGDFRATSLTPASSWQVGLQYGDFTYSYPLRMPPPIAGTAPALALSYDSQATDGATAQANSQPGQLGEGFSLAGGGFIERRYASCADHVGDTNPKNNTGQTNKTGDLCWDGDNGYLSLGGHSGALIKDTGGTWHLAGDDGSIVKLISNSGVTNGTHNNSHWEIITPDGTQYWFGVNQLPGYGSGDTATNSAWTVPVVGLHSGDPCNTSGDYAKSVCPDMAYRWNLDLVVDPNGNATSYYYKQQETSYYAFGSYWDASANPPKEVQGNTWYPYTTGGRLTDIYYGSQVTPSGTPGTLPSGDLYAHRPLHVAFGYSDRCNKLNSDGTVNSSFCDTTSNKTAQYWPDTPWDAWCGSSTGSGCSGITHDSPSFFDTQMLTSVTTSVFEGSNPYQNVDTWNLQYQWLTGDTPNSDLALYSITHTGDVAGSQALKPVIFPATGWTALTSTTYNGGYPVVTRNRLIEIDSETGAVTSITYNSTVPSACKTPPSDASVNTYPCFPQTWQPGGIGDSPFTAWFAKYTVASVTVTDTTGQSPPLTTSYVYCDPQHSQCQSNPSGVGAAWHYDTDIDLVKAKDKSYSQWRGYQYVHVITGTASGPGSGQSETDYTFLRGMNGDPIEPGNKGFTTGVTVTPTQTSGTQGQGPSVTDDNQLNGFLLEKIAYNGLDTGQAVSDQVYWPQDPVTATSAAQPWGGSLNAALTLTRETDGYYPLASGGTRHTQVFSTYDTTNGLLQSRTDYGDLQHSEQELCSTYSYPATLSAAGLIDYPKEVKTTACGQTGSPPVSDVRYTYDGQAWGTAPTAGNVTETDAWSAGDKNMADHWVALSRESYDSNGRVICSENAAGSNTLCIPAGATSCTPDAYTTCTAYTSAYGAGRPTTQVQVTSPLTATTSATVTTDVNPAWGVPNDTIDASKQRTDYAYDPLGRVVKVYLPDQVSVNAQGAATDSATPSYQFTYNVSNTVASSVETQKLIDAVHHGYVTSYALYDSLLRPRQVQAPSDLGYQFMTVTDTKYDTRGNVATQAGPYSVNTGTFTCQGQTNQEGPSACLWADNPDTTPDETVLAYDGAGRRTESDFFTYISGSHKLLWKATWQYPGVDAVIAFAPNGGTATPSPLGATTTYTDARGRATEIDQFQSPTSTATTGPHDATRYSYDPAGRLTGITDAGGNTWSWAYDLLGRQITATDPDTGTTTKTWNDLGQLTSVTDAAQHTISYAYDAAGRKTAEYDTTGGATPGSTNQLAAWTYDTAQLDNTGQAPVTAAVGQLTSATSYVGGVGTEAYKQQVSKYDPFYQPEAATYTIPGTGPGAAVGGSYAYAWTYNPDGSPASQTYPAAGGLAAETVTYGYDSFGYPAQTSGGSSYYGSGYAWDTLRDFDGQITEIDLATAGSGVPGARVDYSYDPATRQLITASIAAQTPGTSSWPQVTNASYSYDASGNMLSATDSVTGDNQCYQYDYLARLTGAWTQPSATCPAQGTTPPGASGLGAGPAPYELTLAYDNVGAANGSISGTTGQVNATKLIAGSGSSAVTTTTGYEYPAYGATQPHAPADYKLNGASQPTGTYAWTKDGQLSGITPASGAATSYNWDYNGMVPGQLATTTTPASGGGTTTTAYRYDAAGHLLVVNDGGTATLYLPGQEVSATGTGNGATITGTRYYALGGYDIAARTAACTITPTNPCTGPAATTTLQWLFGDPHGTSTVAINPAGSTTAQTVTMRYYTPFGQPRGTTPAWPGTKGFVGGTTDTTTGLTNLGAREYNPAAPMFISPDPVLNAYQPTDLNPYEYAANNPATLSDPSGLGKCIVVSGGCYTPGNPQPPTGGTTTTTTTSSTPCWWNGTCNAPSHLNLPPGWSYQFNGLRAGLITHTWQQRECTVAGPHIGVTCSMQTEQEQANIGIICSGGARIGAGMCLPANQFMTPDQGMAVFWFIILTAGSAGAGAFLDAPAAAAGAGDVGDGISLSLRYKAGWNLDQMAAADAKVAALNAAAQRGELVASQVERSGTSAASIFRSAGGNIPPGMDVDHIIDLQLGGADDLSNMSPLDLSVNRSLGPQIAAQLRGVPAGMCITGVTIC
jgi:RHS repeat-associated protein